MDKEIGTLLVVEDDLDIAEMLNAYFRVQGYTVLTVNWGEDGVRACQASRPDLVILDIRLPDIDGFEVAERLQADRRTADIPIIFLTEKRSRPERLKGLALKAEDYITKPFDIQELRLRIRNALERSRRGSLTNPVTRLPESRLVDEALEQSLGRRQSYLVLSVKNLDLFREAHGFVAADDLLRAITVMVNDALKDQTSENSFLGHLTATDFVAAVDPEDVVPLQDRISKRLQQTTDLFYPEQDRQAPDFAQRRIHVDIHGLYPNSHTPYDLIQLKNKLERLIH